MDGTLLDEKHNLPADTAEIVGRMKAMGVKFAAASGRQYQSIRKLFDAAGISDDIIIIAENGGLIRERDKLLHSEVLADGDVKELIGIVEGINGARLLLSGINGAYIGRGFDSEEFEFNARMYYDALTAVDDLRKLPADDGIIKLAVYDPDAEHNCYPILQKYSDRFNVVLSGARWVDIVSKKTDKGSGLRYAAEYYGISPREIMAFGDYLNDLSMIEYAGESYAMENAHPLLKKAAKHIAPPNSLYGVTETIKKTVLGQ